MKEKDRARSAESSEGQRRTGNILVEARASLSLPQNEKDKCDKDKIAGNEQSFSRSAAHAIQVSFAERSATKLTLFHNVVTRRALQESMGYESERKNESYVNSTIGSLFCLDL